MYWLSAFTTLFLLFTLLPLLPIPWWPIRTLDFPRLQLAIMGLVLTVTQLLVLPLNALGTYVLLLPTLAALAYQLWWILPYTPFYPLEVKTSRQEDADNRITLMVANVLTPNRQADKLIAIVKEQQPDVLVTLESDRWWQDKLDTLEDYPHRVACPLDNLYGIHLYSRLRLQGATVEYLVEDDKPSIHTKIILPSGVSISGHFLHPAPPSPTENESSSERDAELLVMARKLDDPHQPTLVSGDLNDVAWSRTTRTFRAVSGLLDPRIGRDMFNTYHADYCFLRWPLDHLFHSDHFTLVRMQRLLAFGSDHFPLLAELQYNPRRRHEQNSPEASAEDKQFAKEKTRAEGVSTQDVPEPGADN